MGYDCVKDFNFCFSILVDFRNMFHNIGGELLPDYYQQGSFSSLIQDGEIALQSTKLYFRGSSTSLKRNTNKLPQKFKPLM